MNLPIDKNGFEITPGDTLKIFHFTGVRRKKHYMYKFVKDIENGRLTISHLHLDEKSYSIPMDGKQLMDFEIVQGYENCKIDFTDRRRKK